MRLVARAAQRKASSRRIDCPKIDPDTASLSVAARSGVDRDVPWLRRDPLEPAADRRITPQVETALAGNVRVRVERDVRDRVAATDEELLPGETALQRVERKVSAALLLGQRLRARARRRACAARSARPRCSARGCTARRTSTAAPSPAPTDRSARTPSPRRATRGSRPTHRARARRRERSSARARPGSARRGSPAAPSDRPRRAPAARTGSRAAPAAAAPCSSCPRPPSRTAARGYRVSSAASSSNVATKWSTSSSVCVTDSVHSSSRPGVMKMPRFRFQSQASSQSSESWCSLNDS